jgi:hypothetical protein
MWDHVGCRSSVDYPPSFFWREMAQAFPDAKILLTVRDAKTWYKSVKESIYDYTRVSQNWPMSWNSKLFGNVRRTKVAFPQVEI